MKTKIIKEVEMVKTIVRVFQEEPTKRQWSEMVSFDAEGNEYIRQHQVYYCGEFHDVEETIIFTKKKAHKKNPY